MMATVEVVKYAFIIICALVSPLDSGITYIDGITLDPIEIDPIMFEYVKAENAFYFYDPGDDNTLVFKITQTDNAGLKYLYEMEYMNESINIDLGELLEDFDLNYLKDKTIPDKLLHFKDQGEIEIYCVGNIVYLRTNAFEGMIFTVHN